jgi:hypothetical protein
MRVVRELFDLAAENVGRRGVEVGIRVVPGGS